MLTFQGNAGIKAGRGRNWPLYMYESETPERLLFNQNGVYLKNGIAPKELRALHNGVWLMGDVAKREGNNLIFLSFGDDIWKLDYAERLGLFSETMKLLTKYQSRLGLQKYVANVIEMLPDMRGHMLALGNERLLEPLRSSPMLSQFTRDEKAIQMIAEDKGGWIGTFSYLAKERTPQADASLRGAGIPLPDRKPSISAPYAGDRVRFSDDLRKDATAWHWQHNGDTVPLIPEYQATNWKRSALVGVRETHLSRHAEKQLARENRLIAVGAIQKAPETLPKPAGQLFLFPELERPIARLTDFTAGFLSPSASLELEHRRKRLGLSQSQLGEKAGLSQPQIANAVHCRFGLSRQAANRIKAALFSMERQAA